MNDYNVAMKYLNEQYGSSLIDYKVYHPNVLRNDEYIDHDQEIHRDFTVEIPNNVLTVTKK